MLIAKTSPVALFFNTSAKQQPLLCTRLSLACRERMMSACAGTGLAFCMINPRTILLKKTVIKPQRSKCSL